MRKALYEPSDLDCVEIGARSIAMRETLTSIVVYYNNHFCMLGYIHFKRVAG
jgi:hypothetical protein